MDTKTEPRAGSNLPVALTDMPVQKLEQGKKTGAGDEQQTPALSGAAFSTFYTWRANGVIPAVRFANGAINANSRVFVNISEYSTDPQHRFIGAARMSIYNIAPFNGGFLAWVEINWPNPLNLRFDVFVDP